MFILIHRLDNKKLPKTKERSITYSHPRTVIYRQLFIHLERREKKRSRSVYVCGGGVVRERKVASGQTTALFV